MPWQGSLYIFYRIYIFFHILLLNPQVHESLLDALKNKRGFLNFDLFTVTLHLSRPLIDSPSLILQLTTGE